MKEFNQGSDEWHDQRIGKITSSRAASILGHSQYASSDDVMRQMVRECFNEPSETIDNIAMKWGREHEKEALYQYEKDTDNFVISTGFIQSDSIEYLGGSPDGLIDEKGIIEIKCPFYKNHIDINKEVHYYDQIQLLLNVTNRHWCDFVVWKPSSFSIVRVDLNNDWMKKSRPFFDEFIAKYKSIISDIDQVNKYTNRKWDHGFDDEWGRLGESYKDSRVMYDFVKKEKDAIKDEMIQKSKKEHDGANIKTDDITLFKSGKTSISYKKIVEKYLPDLDLEPYKNTFDESWSARINKQK